MSRLNYAPCIYLFTLLYYTHIQNIPTETETYNYVGTYKYNNLIRRVCLKSLHFNLIYFNLHCHSYIKTANNLFNKNQV